jgi:hypothetical protein
MIRCASKCFAAIQRITYYQLKLQLVYRTSENEKRIGPSSPYSRLFLVDHMNISSGINRISNRDCTHRNLRANDLVTLFNKVFESRTIICTN